MKIHLLLTDWLSHLYYQDLCALFTFIIGIFGYKLFLAGMFRHKRDKLYIDRLQDFRKAWVEKYAVGNDPIVVVQTMRNKIMIGSFMASTSILLVIGCFNLLFGFDMEKISSNHIFIFLTPDPYIRVIKIQLMIVTLIYSFFHFLWYIRELHQMSLILNVPESRMRETISGNPVEYITHLFLISGFHFSRGIRGYYFMIPLILWMFHPFLMLISFFSIMYFLIKRDLGLVSFNTKS